MSDEFKLHQAKDRGARAEAFVNDEIFKKAIKALERSYIEGWAATDPSQMQARENFWRAVQILGDLQSHFRTVIANGKLAKAELDAFAATSKPTAA